MKKKSSCCNHCMIQNSKVITVIIDVKKISPPLTRKDIINSDCCIRDSHKFIKTLVFLPDSYRKSFGINNEGSVNIKERAVSLSSAESTWRALLLFAVSCPLFSFLSYVQYLKKRWVPVCCQAGYCVALSTNFPTSPGPPSRMSALYTHTIMD